MNPQSSSQVDLGKLFGTVTQVLAENRDSLNSADGFNRNHGDNMVNTFQLITNALKETKGSQPSEQLADASQKLSQQSQSGSAQLYSQGLAEAATRFKNQSAVTPDNALQLVQALMGGQSAPAQSQTPQGDMLSGLLGSLLGGQASETQPPAASTGAEAGPMGDLLGSLLGGSSSGNQAQQGSAGGIDLNMLLSAGTAFFQARQQGAAPVDAVVQALMAGSQMNASSHRTQSGQLVAQTLVNAISSMVSKVK